MSTNPPDHERRHRDLITQITQLGPILPGTINIAHNRCGKPRCRCHADPPQPHGPYTTWTRKVDRKTVTRRLNPEQTARYQPWIDNNRRLRELIHQLEQLTIQTTEHAEGWGKK